MRALTTVPGRVGSAQLVDVPEPVPSGEVMVVRTLAIGICGTDIEVLSGKYGWAPPGRERLVLGHESLGRVEVAPSGSGFKRGDLVVGIVRRPDPEPCASCAVGEWDMCRNGRYTEHGIKELDGFCSERYAIDPRFAVRLEAGLSEVGMLLEPTSIVAKAWEQVERIGARAHWKPERVLVTGAGPIGLLAALLGVQRGLEVHVLDRVREGPKPELVRAVGAIYHSGSLEEACRRAPDIILECTGAGPLVLGAMEKVAPDGIVCLTGVSSGGRTLPIDLGGLNRELVLENTVVFGSVNANRRHYELGAAALAKAESSWLRRLISRRVPLERWRDAVERRADDVKVVIELARD